jgi:hypothetical protein
MLDHEYHERIDTHGVVLHRRFEIQQRRQMPDVNKINLTVKTTYM